MRLKTFCAIGLGVYALLSAADLLLTISLLKTSGEAYEANPAAAAFLERHGWGGLAAFKAGGVLMFFGAVFLLARRKPGVAAGVVTFGCGVLLAVTLYSHNLIRQANAEETELEATKVRHSAPVGQPLLTRILPEPPQSPDFGLPTNAAGRECSRGAVRLNVGDLPDPLPSTDTSSWVGQVFEAHPRKTPVTP
jgi:hypothetical protein